jgi:hypothetical protein
MKAATHTSREKTNAPTHPIVAFLRCWRSFTVLLLRSCAAAVTRRS